MPQGSLDVSEVKLIIIQCFGQNLPRPPGDVISRRRVCNAVASEMRDFQTARYIVAVSAIGSRTHHAPVRRQNNSVRTDHANEYCHSFSFWRIASLVSRIKI